MSERTYCRTAGVILLIIGALGWYWPGIPAVFSLEQRLEIIFRLVVGVLALWAGSTTTSPWLAHTCARLLGLGSFLLAVVGFIHPAVPYGIYFDKGENLLHLALGVWGIWAGFFAKSARLAPA